MGEHPSKGGYDRSPPRVYTGQTFQSGRASPGGSSRPTAISGSMATSEQQLMLRVLKRRTRVSLDEVSLNWQKTKTARLAFFYAVTGETSLYSESALLKVLECENAETAGEKNT